jgi:murein DD-endopeptidase MepM/ murein hydrolase activator NlpD
MLFLYLPIVVYGETSNVLYKMYSKDLRTDVTVLKDGITKAKQTIRINAISSFYNKGIDNLNIDMVDTTIDNLLLQKAEIEKQGDLAIDKPLSEIIALDADYKHVVSKLNDVLKIRDSYGNLDKIEAMEIDTSELSLFIREQEAAVKLAIEFVELGEITTVRHPLDNEYKLNSPYGSRVDPTGRRGVHFHSGVDLNANMNTKVLSIFNGVISDIGYNTAVGNYLRIYHGDGIESYYCHLNKVESKLGDEVKQYDVVALSGNTGYLTTGPHLHFNLYIEGDLVDPAILLEHKSNLEG